MLRAHKDKIVDSDGIVSYAIKLGAQVPDDCANLAFFSKPQLKCNTAVRMFSKWNGIAIKDSGVSSTIFKDLYSEGGILTDKSGKILWQSKYAMLTNEYSVAGVPLFFRQSCSKPIKITDAGSLALYSTKYSGDPIKKSSAPGVVSSSYLYTGAGIKIGIIDEKDGVSTELSEWKYKIKVTSIVDKPNLYTVEVLVDDVYSSMQYVISYNYFDEATNTQKRIDELLTPLPVFYLLDEAEPVPPGYTEDNTFTVTEVEGKYRFSVTSNTIVTQFVNRDPHNFRYRVYADLNESISASLQYQLKIGVIFYEGPTAQINAAKDILCVLRNTGSAYSVPSNVTLVNPNAPYGTLPTMPDYWLLDPSMSMESWLDYDVIIITGAGQVDLSWHAAKIHAFLENGGKLFIENLSNTYRLLPTFNTNSDYITQYSILDVGVSPSAPVNETSTIIGTGTLLSSHFNITNEDCSSMRFNELKVVSVPFVFGESSTNWEKLITYGNGDPAVITKRYSNKGTIIYSNMASIRQARLPSDNTGALKFLANVLMLGVRNKYVSTPWIYDHVINKNNLFAKEYVMNGKTVYVKSSNNDKAKKILANTTAEALAPYVEARLKMATGQYKVECQQFINGKWVPATSVITTEANDGSAQLVAYTDIRNPGSYSPYDDGQTEADILVLPFDTVINYTITPFTYRYESGVFNRISGTPANCRATLKTMSGVTRIGYLSTKLPAIPTSKYWSNPSNIFFEISITDSANCVNIALYDTVLNKYYYSSNGDTIVSYNDVIFNGDSIVILAWSDAYNIASSPSVYSMKYQIEIGKIYAVLPEENDQTERWNLLIHNGSFYGNELLYDFRDHPLPEALLKSIKSSKILYDINHLYMAQPFSLMTGYREVIDEKATYVNRTSIRVLDTPIYIYNRQVENERLSKIGDNLYSSQNRNWSEESEVTVTAVLRDPQNGNISTQVMIGSTYTIDLEKGNIKILEPLADAIEYRASYGHKNIKIIRKLASNQESIREILTNNLGLNQFKLKHENLSTIGTHKPVVYTISNKQKNIIDPLLYEIDAINGVIRFLSEEELPTLFVDYTHYVQTELAIESYNPSNGLIKLKNRISFSDDIFVSYLYNNSFYSYTGYTREDGVFIPLDLNPTDGHTSYNPLLQEVAPTYRLIGKDIYVYLLPYAVTVGDKTTYTRECVRHCFSKEEFTTVQKEYPEAILLAKISIANPYTIEDFTLLDTRRRGGGIKNDKDIAKIGYAQYLWDVSAFDGTIYQSNGVTVVKVPNKILKSNGGLFTTDEIEEIVNQNIPLGVYPIIEYVASDLAYTLPELMSGAPTDTNHEGIRIITTEDGKVYGSIQ